MVCSLTPSRMEASARSRPLEPLPGTEDDRRGTGGCTLPGGQRGRPPDGEAGRRDRTRTERVFRDAPAYFPHGRDVIMYCEKDFDLDFDPSILSDNCIFLVVFLDSFGQFLGSMCTCCPFLLFSFYSFNLLEETKIIPLFKKYLMYICIKQLLLHTNEYRKAMILISWYYSNLYRIIIL